MAFSNDFNILEIQSSLWGHGINFAIFIYYTKNCCLWVPKLLNAQVKLEPLDVLQIVLDLSDGMDDDDVIMIPNPLVHMPCKDGHVLTIGELHVFPTSNQLDLAFFLGTSTSHKLCNFHNKLECHLRIRCIVRTKTWWAPLACNQKHQHKKMFTCITKVPILIGSLALQRSSITLCTKKSTWHKDACTLLACINILYQLELSLSQLQNSWWNKRWKRILEGPHQQ